MFDTEEFEDTVIKEVISSNCVCCDCGKEFDSGEDVEIKQSLFLQLTVYFGQHHLVPLTLAVPKFSLDNKTCFVVYSDAFEASTYVDDVLGFIKQTKRENLIKYQDNN